mmetsp:Transcript_46186/g.122424  ORF Transcript_46186/g.122424 Transcript_46186/m.122424 type:complete len:286 (-) Transcript_46186:509-1366(-)
MDHVAHQISNHNSAVHRSPRSWRQALRLRCPCSSLGASHSINRVSHQIPSHCSSVHRFLGIWRQTVRFRRPGHVPVEVSCREGAVERVTQNVLGHIRPRRGCVACVERNRRYRNPRQRCSLVKASGSKNVVDRVSQHVLGHTNTDWGRVARLLRHRRLLGTAGRLVLLTQELWQVGNLLLQSNLYRLLINCAPPWRDIGRRHRWQPWLVTLEIKVLVQNLCRNAGVVAHEVARVVRLLLQGRLQHPLHKAHHVVSKEVASCQRRVTYHLHGRFLRGHAFVCNSFV